MKFSCSSLISYKGVTLLSEISMFYAELWLIRKLVGISIKVCNEVVSTYFFVKIHSNRWLKIDKENKIINSTSLFWGFVNK